MPLFFFLPHTLPLIDQDKELKKNLLFLFVGEKEKRRGEGAGVKQGRRGREGAETVFCSVGELTECGGLCFCFAAATSSSVEA
jgi:hypothetical protein